MVSTPNEGWGVIRPGDRKAHYYRGGESLCRKVGLYWADLWPDGYESPDDCAACRKKLTLEAERKAAVQPRR